MGSNAERITLNVLSALRKIDDCSRNREFRAKLQAFCNLSDIALHLTTQFKEQGIEINPTLSTFLEGVSVGQNDAYWRVLLHKENYREELVELLGLSFDEACNQCIVPFNRHGLGYTSLEYFIDELKTLVWEYNQFSLRQCPELIADNLAIISLLPKQILNEFKSNFLSQEKEDATDLPRLIVENNIKIKLLS